MYVNAHDELIGAYYSLILGY